MTTKIPFNTINIEILQDSNKLHDWMNSLIKYLDKKKDSVENLLIKGEIYIRLRENKKAITNLEKAIKINKEEITPYYLLGLLLESNDFKQSINYIQLGIQNVSDNTEEKWRLFHLLSKLIFKYEKNFDLAKRYLNKALKKIKFPCFHCKNNINKVDEKQFWFDYNLVEELYPWVGEKLKLNFVSIEVSNDGYVYILENNGRRLFKFNINGDFISGWDQKILGGEELYFIENLWDLTDIVVSKTSDKLYIGSYHGKVVSFDLKGNKLITYNHPNPSNMDRAQSLAIDSKEILYVIYTHTPGIHSFDPFGNYLGSFGENIALSGTGSNYYCGITVDKDDFIYLFDRYTIQKFSDTWSLIQTYFLPGVNLSVINENSKLSWNGITVDNSGNMYVCDTDKNRIVVLDKNGETVRIIDKISIEDKLHLPVDVFFDKYNNLFIIDKDNTRILKYTKDEIWENFLVY